MWFYDARRRLHPYVAPNKCLDLASGNIANGNFLQLWECGAQNQQIWNTNVPSLTPGFLGRPTATNVAIRSAANNMCVDVFAYNFANGSPVVMFRCNGQNNQRWQLDTAVGTLRSTHNTAKCLDAQNGNQGGCEQL
jgi:hypothetical protein